MVYLLYFLLLILSSIYSYSLTDPNLTLFNHPLWAVFREKILYLGYYQRSLSLIIYFSIIILLFFFHLFFRSKYQQVSPLKIALLTAVGLLFSYPFLSHDFINYLFDAKILTAYHQNPYLHKALDFPNDPWLRFMHWTHRTYPYGPVFLLITLIPSFLSLSKFLLNFFLFKTTFTIFYLLAVYCLKKMNKQWAIIFATHPLILVEGLINSHNDLIAISLAIIGIYYLFNNKMIKGKSFLILSGGIKYITLPSIILKRKKESLFNKTSFLGLVAIILYLSLKSEIQPWYFLNLFIFLPFYDNLIKKLNLFLIGLLISYYPYIRLGGWDKLSYIEIKHQIIYGFLTLNLLLILLRNNFLKGEP